MKRTGKEKMMKRSIAVVLAAVFVVGGLGSVAVAADSDFMSAMHQRFQRADIDNPTIDSVTASEELTGNYGWHFHIGNNSGGTVYSPTITVNSSLVDPSFFPAAAGSWPFTTSLDSLADGERWIMKDLWSSLPVTFTTGYNCSRTMVPLEIAPGGGVQTVTVKVKPIDERYSAGAFMRVSVRGNVVSGSNTQPGEAEWQIDPEGPSKIVWTLRGAQFGTEYTFSVQIQVENQLDVSLVHKPDVQTYMEVTQEVVPDVTGTSISTSDPDAPVLVATYSVTDEHPWHAVFGDAWMLELAGLSQEIGGTISGCVVDSDTGQPVSGAKVEVIVHESLSGHHLHLGWAYTDALGNYTSSAVPTGDYAVRVRADGYVTEWHPGTYNQDEATSVEVNAPYNTQDIDFTLELGGTISGCVTDVSGDGIGDAKVEVIVHESLSGHHLHLGWASTDALGNYTSSTVPAGQYAVRVKADGYVQEWYQDTYNENEATPVSVTAPDDTPDIDFSLELGGTISGCVTNSTSGEAISDAKVEVIVYESLSGDHLHLGWARTDADGDYTSSAVPTGDYAVRVKADGYVTEWYPGTYNQDEATSVLVTAPYVTSPIDFSLELGGTISGRVADSGSGDGIGDAKVEVIVYESLSGHHLHLGWARTDADGDYTSSAVPAGRYAVRARADGYALKWYDDTYSKDEAADVEVIVGEDEPGINFALEPLVPRETVEEAIADGIAWLAGQQNEDGFWGTQYPLAKTALAVLKLESHAADSGFSSPFDEGYLYHTQVEEGLDYIFANAYTIGIGTQPAGNPDWDGDDLGVYFYISGEGHDPAAGYSVYNTGMAMMAIAASTEPDRVVAVSGSPVDGWTYREVLRDAVDYMAWAQTDSGWGRGGWNYGPMNNAGSRSDQSNSGWAALGLAHAQAPPPSGFGLPVPGFVKAELDVWIDYIQDDVDGDDDDGGSWYGGPGDPDPTPPAINILKTGHLLQQMAFVGDTEETTRVGHALDYLVRHWGEKHGHGWRRDPSCHQSTYTTMKGLEAFEIVIMDSIDWFQDFSDALLGEQAAEGWWVSCRYDDGDRILSTEWALLTLQRLAAPAPPGPPPIAEAGGPYVAGVGLPVTLDGSGSYHEEGRPIVDYHWRFGDGKMGSGETAEHIYYSPGLYTAELMVTDNVSGIDTDTAMVVVYDPSAGFATGGGWLIPGGSSSDDGDLLPRIEDGASPAEFGFVVKYKPGAATPSGQLEFQYRQGDFNLHSKGMDWLVIVNSNWAKFKGEATIKGFEGIYPFRVDARDGDFGGGGQPDRFIIKVYAPGSDPDGSDPIYKASGNLEGGSIVIHAKKLTTLRVQSAYSADTPGYQAFETWAQTTMKTSDGRLQIEPYPAGAIVPSFDAFDAVQSGVLDGFVGSSHYWSGKGALANYLTSYPFGLDEPYMWETWFYERGGIELARADYARSNMHYVGPVAGGPEYAHCVKPLYTMEDWNGLKCRYPGGMIGDVFTKAGAEVTWIPGAQLCQAMADGVIELAEYSSHYTNQQLGLHEVGKYIIGPGQMHGPVVLEAFVVNMDTWNRLPSSLQGLLTTGVSDLSWSTLDAIRAADVEALNWMVEYGCKYIEIPDAERAEFRLISVEFWREYATDASSLEAVESQILLMWEEGLLDFPGLKEEVEIYFPGLLPNP